MPVDHWDAWVANFVATRNAAPRYVGPDPDVPDGSHQGGTFGGGDPYWTENMFAISDEIIVTAQRIAADHFDTLQMLEQVEHYQSFLTLLNQLNAMGDQAGFLEIDGVSDGVNQTIAEMVAKFLKDLFNPQDPNPLFNANAVAAREAASNFDADGALEVLVMDNVNNEFYRYWIVRDPDAPTDPNQSAFWYDMNANGTPDTFVEMTANGNLYWDSNSDGHGDTYFANPWTLDWPG